MCQKVLAYAKLESLVCFGVLGEVTVVKQYYGVNDIYFGYAVWSTIPDQGLIIFIIYCH